MQGSPSIAFIEKLNFVLQIDISFNAENFPTTSTLYDSQLLLIHVSQLTFGFRHFLFRAESLYTHDLMLLRVPHLQLIH
jgi:hypothetical protein